MDRKVKSDNKKYTLSTTPEGIVDSLLAHINSLDADVMFGFYEADGILVNAKGEAQRGEEEIKAELSRYFSFGLPMSISARHIFVAGDTASLVLDWNIVGVGKNGENIHMVATSNDIARKGADGYWRYIIDNPFGTQIRSLY